MQKEKDTIRLDHTAKDGPEIVVKVVKVQPTGMYIYSPQNFFKQYTFVNFFYLVVSLPNQKKVLTLRQLQRKVS